MPQGTVTPALLSPPSGTNVDLTPTGYGASLIGNYTGTEGGIGANELRGVRCVMPRSGTLTGVSFFVAVSSGNVALAVYDTGQALAASITRLATSGSVACGGALAWQSFAANLAVTQGQQVFLCLAVDNATVEFANYSAFDRAMWVLPTGFIATPAAAGLLAIRVAASFPPPAAITNASLAAAQPPAAPFIIFRVS